MSVIDPETQGMNQVQSYFSGPAQPGDVPGIGGYFGLVKDHMEVGIFENPVSDL
jgi:hypothetical protein